MKTSTYLHYKIVCMIYEEQVGCHSLHVNCPLTVHNTFLACLISHIAGKSAVDVSNSNVMMSKGQEGVMSLTLPGAPCTTT